MQLWRDAKGAQPGLRVLAIAVAGGGALGAVQDGIDGAVAYGSAAATVTAAILALLIYSWTVGVSRRAQTSSEEHHAELRELLERALAGESTAELEAPPGDLAAEETLPEDEFADATPYEVPREPLDRLDIRINHVLLREVPLSRVPIRVLGDLYVEWMKREYTGRWDVGRLIEVRRKPGQGNNPYLLLFNRGRRDRLEDLELWKVAYGGQGKTDATVTRLFPISDASHREVDIGPDAQR